MQSSNTVPDSVSEMGINNNVTLTRREIYELSRSKMLDKDRIAQAEMNMVAIDKRTNEANELEMKNKIIRQEAEKKRKKEKAYEQTWRYQREQQELENKRNALKSRMLTKYPILVWKSSLYEKELLALKTIRPILALYRLHRLKIKYNKLKLKTMNKLFEITNKHLANDPNGREEVVAMELINETPACVSTSQFEGTSTNKINKVIEIKIGTVNVAVDEISEIGIVAASTYVGSDIETSAKNVGRGNDLALDRIYGLSNDKSRKNLTCNGLTYNCTKCLIGKVPEEVTKYYSCAMVYHTCDATWKQIRQSKDKIDSDKAKCGGTLMVRYTLSEGFVVTANRKHKCYNK